MLANSQGSTGLEEMESISESISTQHSSYFIGIG